MFCWWDILGHFGTVPAAALSTTGAVGFFSGATFCDILRHRARVGPACRAGPRRGPREGLVPGRAAEVPPGRWDPPSLWVLRSALGRKRKIGIRKKICPVPATGPVRACLWGPPLNRAAQ